MKAYEIDPDTSLTYEGPPTMPGLYAVEIYFGWKLLEWKDGGWWHPALVGRWLAGDPIQWVGPLPERMLIKGKKGEKPEMKVYDL